MKLCEESILNSKLVKAPSQKPKCNTVIEPNITEEAGGKQYFLRCPPPEWSPEFEFHSTDLIKGGNTETHAFADESNYLMLWFANSSGLETAVLLTSHTKTNGLWTSAGARRAE